MICLNCSSEFASERTDAKFCCASCRAKHWKSSKKEEPKKSYDNLSPEDLKLAMIKSMVEAKKMITTFNRLFQEFQEWQDDIIALQAKLDAAQQTKVDALDALFE